MEVIYTGLHRTPKDIVRAALDEDVQVVGISVLSGAHNRLVPSVVSGLRDAGMDDVIVVVGGIIPADDAAELLAQGVAAIFTPGTPVGDVVAFIQQEVCK
jgi:methylmalonyl-CoA mutase C-terminal domain/subunit